MLDLLRFYLSIPKREDVHVLLVKLWSLKCLVDHVVQNLEVVLCGVLTVLWSF